VPLVKRMTPELRDKVRGLEGLAAFRAGVRTQLGEQIELLSESVETRDTRVVHRRVARFERSADAEVEITWAFDGAGAISGFSVRPRPKEAASRYLDYRTQTPLRLPFDGEWTVFNGGRTLATNPHAAARNQRFAVDLAVVRDGRTFRGDGNGLADYHVWGAPVLAPAAGKVVATVDGLPDNTMGTTDRENLAGNHVILDHGNGEYSFLAHFQRASLAVIEGQEVEAGHALGRVGNSGNSSEPHLHYHLQDGPVFAEAESMPAAFVDYVADDRPVGRGELHKGQRVRTRNGADAAPVTLAGGGRRAAAAGTWRGRGPPSGAVDCPEGGVRPSTSGIR
jgi:murein DD-endopeptidase MepM/ murein hydrolase activator NlpD